MFSSLGPLEGASVVDLFAGSGALGIGALSRGAARAVFVDSSRRHARVIQHNVRALGLSSRCIILTRAVVRARQPVLAHAPFDLVFADPPYATLAAAAVDIARLLAPPLLRPQARLVLEHARRDAAPSLAGFEHIRTRPYGSTSLSYFAGPSGLAENRNRLT